MNLNQWKKKLKSNDPLERIDAAEVLPEGSPDEIVPALIEALEDKSNEDIIQINLLQSLRLFPCEAARVSIRKFLEQDHEELVKGFALDALGRVGVLSDLKRLLADLESATSSRIRLYVISGLFHRIQDFTLAEIETSAKNQDMWIRTTAASILTSLCENWTHRIETTKKIFEEQLALEPSEGGREELIGAMDWINGFLELSKKIENSQ